MSLNLKTQQTTQKIEIQIIILKSSYLSMFSRSSYHRVPW